MLANIFSHADFLRKIVQVTERLGEKNILCFSHFKEDTEGDHTEVHTVFRGMNNINVLGYF